VGDVTNKQPPDQKQNSRKLNDTTVERCNLVRRRRSRQLHSKAKAFVFRSKICQPLSHKTPAFLLDTIRDFSDDSLDRSVYLSIYDTTYRVCDLDLAWVYRIANILTISTNKKYDSRPPVDAIVSEPCPSDSSIVINVSDCFPYSFG